jgi:hypothetical protein
VTVTYSATEKKYYIYNESNFNDRRTEYDSIDQWGRNGDYVFLALITVDGKAVKK